ncbi:MAG: DUF2214 domain-containing protein [Burkholderiales bacterium]|nr:DUF2214 domain-containing protein [Burkholderiales bacterium]PZN06341.1 MAG: DUF2214 domain-containing protein [Pseudomonadota bacterium]
MTETFLLWLGGWPGALWLQESWRAYLFVNAAHILGIGLLLGAILPLDLRLIGFMRGVPLGTIAPILDRTATFGAALAIATGLWLFTVKPLEYAGNAAFLAKLVLLALAFVNVAFQHSGGDYRTALAGGPVSAKVRTVAALSALLWLAILIAGRWIGFI